jgi:hypothetical protein
VPPNRDLWLVVAMWSGPRNISTAMMRAWENRTDTAVWDEPLYGPYLAATGIPHPGAADVIASQGSDWRPIVERLAGPPPEGRSILYQKHMTHHLLPDIDRTWMDEVSNCFLIRDPADVVASYSLRRAEAAAADLGFDMQVELFGRMADRLGRAPPVLDAADVLKDPEGMLRRLCEVLGVDFSDRMLSWPAGPRPTDGVWARHWYDAVWRSTGWSPWQRRGRGLDDRQAALAEQCRAAYEFLHRHRLAPVTLPQSR